mmetsp:Transcript_88018/g.226948  ORF Transcript_88018/g.226948 Transcript_88018/m.226948 type:complete len:329 (-) Transcript_88018:2509-3495(-)
MSRTRCCWPLPHVALHCVQLLHSDIWQSRSEQGTWPQLSVSARSPSQGLPPSSARSATSRVRKRWPPPHVTPHSPHSAQLLHWQSLGPIFGHGPDASTGPLHGRPLPLAGRSVRLRWACRSPGPSQPCHSDHVSSSQSLDPASQLSVLQGFVRLSAPSQAAPPPCACWRTSRRLSCWPPPHVLSHCDHSPQAPMMQSCAWGVTPTHSSHGVVSVSAPLQASPLLPAFTFTVRSRFRWPCPGAQLVHSPQPSKTHACLPLHSSFRHSFVTARGSSHGFPHSLACLTIVRARLHTPSQPSGSSHSLQLLYSQSCGKHTSCSHLGRSGQLA